MPRFVDKNETKVIRAPWWAEKEIAVIRKFSYGDRQYLVGETVRVGMVSRDGQTEDAVGEMALGQMNLAMIERSLVIWMNPDGEEMPVTREAIEALAEDDGDFILKEIRALNPRRQRSPDEQEKFRDRPGGGDQERDGVAAGS